MQKPIHKKSHPIFLPFYETVLVKDGVYLFIYLSATPAAYGSSQARDQT